MEASDVQPMSGPQVYLDEPDLSQAIVAPSGLNYSKSLRPTLIGGHVKYVTKNPIEGTSSYSVTGAGFTRSWDLLRGGDAIKSNDMLLYMTLTNEVAKIFRLGGSYRSLFKKETVYIDNQTFVLDNRNLFDCVMSNYVVDPLYRNSTGRFAEKYAYYDKYATTYLKTKESTTTARSSFLAIPVNSTAGQLTATVGDANAVTWKSGSDAKAETYVSTSMYSYSTENDDVGEPHIGASSADNHIVLPVNFPLFSKLDLPLCGLVDLRYEVEFDSPNAIALNVDGDSGDLDTSNFTYALTNLKLEVPYWQFENGEDRKDYNDAILANGRSWIVPWYSVILGHSTTAGQTDENIDISESISSAKSLVISMRRPEGLTSTGYRNLTQRIHNKLNYLYLIGPDGRQIPFEKQDVSSAYRVFTKNKDIVSKQNDVTWATRLSSSIVSTTDPDNSTEDGKFQEMAVDFFIDLTRYSDQQNSVIVGTILSKGAYVRLEFGTGGATSITNISTIINYDALVRRNPAGQGPSFEIKKFFTPIDYLS